MRVTLAAVPLADWKRIVEKAKEQALEGDAKAREWLCRILLGDTSTITFSGEKTIFSGGLSDEVADQICAKILGISTATDE